MKEAHWRCPWRPGTSGKVTGRLVVGSRKKLRQVLRLLEEQLGDPPVGGRRAAGSCGYRVIALQVPC